MSFFTPKIRSVGNTSPLSSIPTTSLHSTVFSLKTKNPLFGTMENKVFYQNSLDYLETHTQGSSVGKKGLCILNS